MKPYPLVRDLVRSHRWLYALVGWPTRHRLRVGARYVSRSVAAALSDALLLTADAVLRLLRVDVVLPFNSQRIGHQVHEPRAYLTRRALGIRRRYPVFVINKSTIANEYMQKLWDARWCFLDWRDNARLGTLQRYAKKHQDGAFRFVYSGDGNEDDKRRSFSQYTRINSLVRFPSEDEDRGAELLERLGIPRDAWVVCLHVREGGFLPHLSYHSHRDCDIMSYLPAIQHLTTAGGYVVRMGDPSMKRLPHMPRLLDYAHSEARTAFLDIYLSYRCRFFVGVNSGPVDVPFLFHKPLVLTNVVPFTDSYAKALFVPKLIFDEGKGRYLSFREIVDRGIDQICRAEAYASAGLRVVDNDPQDILDVVKEQLLKLDAALTLDSEELALRENCDRLMQARGYEAGACPEMSPAFMRKHRELLEVRCQRAPATA